MGSIGLRMGKSQRRTKDTGKNNNSNIPQFQDPKLSNSIVESGRLEY